MRVPPFSFVVILVAFSLAAYAEQPDGPFANIRCAAVPIDWQYSNDGGKTFVDRPHPAPPPGRSPNHEQPVYPFVWKGTFQINDPAKIAGLWVRIFEEHTKGSAPRASICNGDLVAASGGYWKDLGYCPTLLEATVTLNGREVPIAHGPMLQFWVPLLGEIRKGANTVELRGNVYTYWGGAPWAGSADGPVKALDARIIAAEPQPADICNGPILGDFGDTYFTLACRTQMPADVTVEATPVEPAGQPIAVASSGNIWHRMRIEIPKGTRKISYTISTKVAAHVTKRGPFAVTLPGDRFCFAAFGNAMQHVAREGDAFTANCKVILKTGPDFVVNTGNIMEQCSWSFNWEGAYTRPAGELLSRVPTLITPCGRDFPGIFDELHYTPGPNGFGHTWTKVVGSVRFIGINGNHDWSAGGQNIKWLEEVLAGAKEKFIIVLSGWPGYSSGINSKRMYGGIKNVREVVMPLLGRHKATLMLSGWDPDYERLEPTADRGIPQIVTGAIGHACWHRWESRMGSHPFGPGAEAMAAGKQGKVSLPDGREWCGYCSTRHFCLFDVTDEAIELRVLATPPPGTDAAIADLKVLDRKTFRPRR